MENFIFRAMYGKDCAVEWAQWAKMASVMVGKDSITKNVMK